MVIRKAQERARIPWMTTSLVIMAKAGPVAWSDKLDLMIIHDAAIPQIICWSDKLDLMIIHDAAILR